MRGYVNFIILTLIKHFDNWYLGKYKKNEKNETKR